MVKTSKKVSTKKSKISEKNDSSILEESFNLIKKLNSQVGIIEKSKNLIQDKLEVLDNRISKHEKSSKNNLTSKIKDNILEEFSPILKSFNTKSLKKNIILEIEKIIELELHKLKSDLNSKTNKSKKEVLQIVSDLEVRVFESIKNLDSIKDLLKKQEIKERKSILSKVNLSISKSLENVENNFNILLNSKNLEIDKINIDIKKQSNNISLLKSNLKNVENNDLEQINKFEKLIKDLTTKNLSLKTLVETLDTNFKNFEKLNKNLLKSNFSKEIKTLKTDLNNDFNQIANEFIIKIDENLRSSNMMIETKFSDSTKEIESYKYNLSKLVKNYVTEVDKKLISISKFDIDLNNKVSSDCSFLKEEFSKFEKEKSSEIELFITKINKIITNFNENKINDKDQNTKQIKEEISKEILKLNDFKSKINNEISINKKNIEEEVETKFINSSKQYDKIFEENLNKFDTGLKERESSFLSKLIVIENDKNLMLEDLNSFKIDISNLTKEYINNLDFELKKIKTEEKTFEKEKEEFSKELSDLAIEKKNHLEHFGTNLEISLKKIITEEKESFDRHENTFREVFNQKISNLQDITNNKLNSIEKKFVGKNLEYVNNLIKTKIHEIELIKEELISKEEELNFKQENFDTKINELFESLNIEQEKSSQNAEERLTILEKQLNKRFLDYDSDISNFKSIVIDEIEGLMNEVNTLISSKVENFDKNIAKSNFINNEATNKILDMGKVHNQVEEELKDIRDEVSDIRVKLEITSPTQNLHNINDHVKFMSEYENQLIALIKNLKEKGISQDRIKQVLISKGHPRFYINMMIDNYDELIN